VTLLSCFLFSAGPLAYSHSFPTRRSSDLRRWLGPALRLQVSFDRLGRAEQRGQDVAAQRGNAHPGRVRGDVDGGGPDVHGAADRSEEHTSELQSRVDLVCRLLLEKKKHKR